MTSVRFVCPLNGTPTRCGICKKDAPHQREELAPAGRKPRCETHGIEMVPA